MWRLGFVENKSFTTTEMAQPSDLTKLRRHLRVMSQRWARPIQRGLTAQEGPGLGPAS